MFTDFELSGINFESFLGADVLTPATVDELSEDLGQSSASSPTQQQLDDYSMFYSMPEEKPTYPTTYQIESPEAECAASPTDSTQSADLLDLETVSFHSWNAARGDLNDPDWLPEDQDQHNTNYIKSTSTNQSSKCSRSSIIPAKATKRRNSSLTSEIELQIEIEENTKRAKRCTAPLTEEQKRLRRKELNRLAAQRCRSKRKSHADVLEDEIDVLTKKNRELRDRLEDLETTKNELYDVIKFHFASCHGK